MPKHTISMKLMVCIGIVFMLCSCGGEDILSDDQSTLFKGDDQNNQDDSSMSEDSCQEAVFYAVPQDNRNCLGEGSVSNPPEELCRTDSVYIVLRNNHCTEDDQPFVLPTPTKTGCSRFTWTLDGEEIVPFIKSNKTETAACDPLELDELPKSFKAGEYSTGEKVSETNVAFGNTFAEDASFFNEIWTAKKFFGTDLWPQGKYEITGVYKICLGGTCKLQTVTADFIVGDATKE